MDDCGPEQAVHKLCDVLKSGEAVAWIGAGLSQALGYPGWKATVDKLGNACELAACTSSGDRDEEKLIEHAEACKQKDGRAYKNCLKKLFGNVRRDRNRRALKFLMQLPFRAYITTNFDPLLALEYEDTGLKEMQQYPRLLTKPIGEGKRPLYYIHGFARKDGKPTGENLILASGSFATI